MYNTAFFLLFLIDYLWSNIFFLILFLFYYLGNAQNDIVVKGTVIDGNTQLPLELATVYFTKVQDSTIIEYATTNKNGVFNIKTKKYDKPIFWKLII